MLVLNLCVWLEKKARKVADTILHAWESNVSISSVDIHVNIHELHVDLNVCMVAGQMSHTHIINITKYSYLVYSG